MNLTNTLNKNGYVLVTPAKNEEAYIEKTIRSIISQTVLPKRWVIVSDGSTDRTDKIVNEYAGKYKFIHLISLPKSNKRNFASKVEAIRRGFESLKDIEYDYYGNLDGDVSFEPGYYEYLLSKFLQYPKLGIAGGRVYDFYKGAYHKHHSNLNSVSGPIQLFRRKCYQEIGGYKPLKKGLVDAVAEIEARQYGWQTRTFPELKVWHHRLTGTAQRNIFRVRFDAGINEYRLGYHYLYHVSRCLYKATERPYVLGSLLIMGGFLYGIIRNEQRAVPDNFIRYLRDEQMSRLRSVISKERKFVITMK